MPRRWNIGELPSLSETYNHPSGYTLNRTAPATNRGYGSVGST